MRYAKGQEETLKNCTQRRVKAGHLPKKCSDVSSSSWGGGQPYLNLFKPIPILEAEGVIGLNRF